jgi:hypothetical protein
VIPIDKRMTRAWLIAPLSSIAFFRAGAIFAIPATYFALVLLGIPVLRFCIARKWLQWWHALAAGWLAGTAVALLFLFDVDPYHTEIHGPTEMVVLQAYGGTIGFLIWIIAIYRNPTFPQRPTQWIVLVPALILFPFASWRLLDRFEVTEAYGSLVSKPSNGLITYELGDGSRVEARVMRFLDDKPLPAHGTVGAYTRLPVLPGQRRYWISGVCKSTNDDRQIVCDFDEASRDLAPPPPRMP